MRAARVAEMRISTAPRGRTSVKFMTADIAAAPSKSYDAVVSGLDSGKRHFFADIFKYLTPVESSSMPTRRQAKAPRSMKARARCGSNTA
jgi:hypothetical protein